MGERAGLGDRRGGTAAPLGVVLGVGPQLERDGNRRAVPGTEQRDDRAVDAAAHGDEHPRAVDRGRQSARPRAAAPRARASASAASSAAWILAVLTPPSSSAIAADPIRAASSRGPRGRASPPRSRPPSRRHPVGGEPGVGDPLAVGASENLIRSQQEPPSAVTVKFPPDVPEALRRGQVMFKGEWVHPREDEAAYCGLTDSASTIRCSISN